MENIRTITTISMRISLVLVLLLGFVFQGVYNPKPVDAWNNIGTHPGINEFAYNSFLSQWQPNDPNFKLASFAGTARGESWEPGDGTSWTNRNPPQIREKSVKDWLIEGGFSADEPELSQSLVHFYDPSGTPAYLTDYINDIPSEIGTWYNPNTDAYQWAFESADNPFSFANGEQYFQSAVASKEAGDINYGKAWRAVGETMHLISDMTVPAHVRNDAHIPYAKLWDPLEYFTNAGDVTTYGTYGTALPATSDFGDYHTAYNTGKDIRTLFKQVASWTNQNFFSGDTVPQYDSDKTPNGKKAYPSPVVTIDPNFTGYYTTTLDGNDKFPLARASIAGIIWKKPYLVVDQTVCNAQRSVLLPTAIKASAAVMDAFLPRFEVVIDKAEPDTKTPGNFIIAAHIKQIPTREWPHDLLIRNGANILADGKQSIITTNSNLDNHDTLNKISYSVTAKEGSSITLYYNFGGYKVSSAEFKIVAGKPAIKIDPSSMKDAEKGKPYTFQSRIDNSPAKFFYKWFLDGLEVPSKGDGNFTITFSDGDSHTVKVALVDSNLKPLADAEANITMKSAAATSSTSPPSSSATSAPLSTSTDNQLIKLQQTSTFLGDWSAMASSTELNIDTGNSSGSVSISCNIPPAVTGLTVRKINITWNGTSFSGTTGPTAANPYVTDKLTGTVSEDGKILLTLEYSSRYYKKGGGDTGAHEENQHIQLKNVPIGANCAFSDAFANPQKYLTAWGFQTATYDGKGVKHQERICTADPNVKTAYLAITFGQ